MSTFLVVAVLVGRFVAPQLFDVIERMRVRYVLLVASIAFALGLVGSQVKQCVQLMATLYRLFQGPIATTLDNQRLPFLPVDPPTPGKNVYPWGVSLNLVEPDGHGRCVVRYRSWVHDARLRGTGMRDGATTLVPSSGFVAPGSTWREATHPYASTGSLIRPR